MQRIGILAHSAEGSALCYLEVCHEGERRLGAHLHPDVVLDIEPWGTSLSDWEKRNYAPIGRRLASSVARLAAAGAGFFVCPDNTAHMALEAFTDSLSLPGLHIAEVVADEAKRRGFHRVAITGTSWTMDGPIYPRVLNHRGIDFAVPSPSERATIQQIIVDELLPGRVTASARASLATIVERLRGEGCDCVLLGCTELPLLLDDTTSPLPTLDSTRLLARAAVDVALGARPLPTWRGGALPG